MDVEDEDGNASDADSIMDEDEDEDGGEEDEGEDGSPKKRKRKGKSKSKQTAPPPALPDMSNLSSDQVALVSLQHQKVEQAKQWKDYYADAASFAETLRDATNTLHQLLGSKSKAEVLEVMEFFRVALDYKMDSAEVRTVPRSFFRVSLICL
jgi:condensin complex subunit 1